MDPFHILLVDDDVMTSAVLREYLETLKYTVSLADSCHEAAQRTRSERSRKRATPSGSLRATFSRSGTVAVAASVVA